MGGGDIAYRRRLVRGRGPAAPPADQGRPQAGRLSRSRLPARGQLADRRPPGGCSPALARVAADRCGPIGVRPAPAPALQGPDQRSVLGRLRCGSPSRGCRRPALRGPDPRRGWPGLGDPLPASREPGASPGAVLAGDRSWVGCDVAPLSVATAGAGDVWTPGGAAGSCVTRRVRQANGSSGKTQRQRARSARLRLDGVDSSLTVFPSYMRSYGHSQCHSG